MHNHTGTGQANGNIRRGRVVFLSDDFIVSEASVNTSFPPIGITMEYTRFAPGTPFDTSLYAATDGLEVAYTGNGGVAKAECGGTVTAGKAVTYDSTARIVDATGFPGPVSYWVVGIAREDGAAGDVVRVDVNIR